MDCADHTHFSCPMHWLINDAYCTSEPLDQINFLMAHELLQEALYPYGIAKLGPI